MSGVLRESTINSSLSDESFVISIRPVDVFGFSAQSPVFVVELRQGHSTGILQLIPQMAGKRA